MRNLAVPAFVGTLTLLTVTGPADPAGATGSVTAPGGASNVQVKLAGVLHKVAVDVAANPSSATPDLHGFESTDHEVRYAITTRDGSTVPLDADSLPDELTAAPDGTRVTAEVTLDGDARADLADAGIDPADATRDGGLTVEAAQALDASSTELPVDGAVTVAPTVSTTTTTAAGVPHRFYSVVISDGLATGDFTTTTSGAVLANAANYWETQTRQAISFDPVTTSRLVTWNGSCTLDPDTLWSRAEALFPSTSFSPTSGNHLVVFAPASCGEAPDAYAGLGTVGSGIASGGEIIVQDGAWSVLAHELGHNLGLGHSNLEMGPCVGDPVQEYYGFFGPQAAAVGSYKPGALDVAYQDQLGVAEAGAIRDVAASDAASQVTLAPVFATDGLRGLRFTDLKTGDRFYAEYRPGTDEDAGTYYSTFLGAHGTFELGGRSVDYTPGLRVYRYDPVADDLETMSAVNGSALDTTVTVGQTYTGPSGFSVTLDSTDAAGAQVTVRPAGTAVRSSTSAGLSKTAATYGTTVSTSVLVSPVSSAVPASTVPACGVAEVYVGARKLVTTPLTGGRATYRLPATLSAGAQTVTVKYLGSSGVQPSQRSTTLTVTKARASLGTTSMSTVRRGARARVTVRLKGVGAQPPTGKVHLRVGGKAVSGWYAVRTSGLYGSVIFTTLPLPHGTVQVAYTGNANLVSALYGTGRTVS